MLRIGVIVLLLLWGMFLPSARGDSGVMPIMAFMGVPDYRTTEADFRTFRDCGFNVSYYPYRSLAHLVTACRCAERCGVKVMGTCPEIDTTPGVAARTLREEKGFFGYFMGDEPSVTDIRDMAETMAVLSREDTMHTTYINLLPYYYPDRISEMVKAVDYPTYLRAASATPCKQISFDFYPIVNNGIRATWYHNLEMVRLESLRSGKPFWGFVLSVPHAVYPQPTMGALRLQVYSNLAYGAQAIQYFTYWTPRNNPKYDFHDGPIGLDGKKSKTYHLVQSMNRELTSVSSLFYGSQVVSVGHLGNISNGTKRLDKLPENIAFLKVAGKKGALVSQLLKDGHRYLVIVNKDHLRTMKVTLRAANSLPVHITKELAAQPMKTEYKVSAGDMLMFKLN